MNDKVRIVLAFDQCVGGLIGVIYASMLVHHTAALTQAITIIFLLLNGATLLAGILLWRSSLSGFRLSVILQALQVPFLQLKGFSYLFTTGLSVLVYILSDFYVWVRLNFLSQWMLLVGGTFPGWVIGIDIVAIVTLILLIWGWPRPIKVDEDAVIAPIL